MRLVDVDVAKGLVFRRVRRGDVRPGLAVLQDQARVRRRVFPHLLPPEHGPDLHTPGYTGATRRHPAGAPDAARFRIASRLGLVAQAFYGARTKALLPPGARIVLSPPCLQ